MAADRRSAGHGLANQLQSFVSRYLSGYELLGKWWRSVQFKVSGQPSALSLQPNLARAAHRWNNA